MRVSFHGIVFMARGHCLKWPCVREVTNNYINQRWPSVSYCQPLFLRTQATRISRTCNSTGQLNHSNIKPWTSYYSVPGTRGAHMKEAKLGHRGGHQHGLSDVYATTLVGILGKILVRMLSPDNHRCQTGPQNIIKFHLTKQKHLMITI